MTRRQTKAINGEPASPKPPRIGANGSALSDRQSRLVALLAEGLTDREIAEKTGLSEQTVGSYLKTIFRACGVHSRAALAVHWVSHDHGRNIPTNVGIARPPTEW